MAAKISEIALWLHDRQCVSYASGWCCGDGRKDHAQRTQREPARQMMAAESLEHLATLMHEKFCPLWNERPHGSYFIQRSDAACGEGGSAHAAQMAELTTFKELAGLLGFI